MTSILAIIPKRATVARTILCFLALCAVHVAAHAQSGVLNGGSGSSGSSGSSSVPEVDPSLAAGGLALVGGVVLVVRARRSVN